MKNLLLFIKIFLFCFVIVIFSISIYFFLNNWRKIIISDEKNNIYLYETIRKRCISFSSNFSLNQSCIYKNNPDKLVHDYNKMILGFLYLNPKPNNILLIGLGGGTIAKTLTKTNPEAKIDIVEINPSIPDIARKYFLFPQNDNITIIIDEGSSYLNNYKEKNYDVIIIDAFDDKYIPHQFLTDSFIENLKHNLTDTGIAIINTFKNSPTYEQETKLFLSHFSSIYNISINNKVSNRIIIAQKNSKSPSTEYFKRQAYFFEKDFQKLGIDKNWLLNKFSFIKAQG